MVWAEDKSKKLQSRIDSSGSGPGQNPTWNDKFLFRVSPQFSTTTTSAVSVEIYTVRRYLRYSLVGSARCLINTGKFISSVHVHRPSGSFHGILNIAATVCDGADDRFFEGYGSSSMNFRSPAFRREVVDVNFYNRLRGFTFLLLASVQVVDGYMFCGRVH